MRGRLVICDYNLADERGHHLTVANTLARAAEALDLDCAVLANERLAPGLVEGEPAIHRLFPTSFYEARTAEGRPRDLSHEIAARLERAARNGLLDGADMLIHSGDGHLARALAMTLTTIVRRGATVHFATPYDPNVMPGGLGPGGCDGALRDLLRREEANRTILFWAETAPLATFYSRVYGVQTAHLPIPTPDWACGPTRPTAQDGLVLAFFGAAREEKGFLKLPDIVEAVCERRPPGLSVAFRIQASAPIAGMTDAVAAALASLRASPDVTVIEGALSEADYAREMIAADAILLPYDRRKYAVRGSGIAVEALSLGKILMAPPGSFVDEAAPPGLVVHGETAEVWAEGLFRLLGERRRVDERAARERAVEAFRAARTGEACLRRLFARRDLAAFAGLDAPNLGEGRTLGLVRLGPP